MEIRELLRQPSIRETMGIRPQRALPFYPENDKEPGETPPDFYPEKEGESVPEIGAEIGVATFPDLL